MVELDDYLNRSIITQDDLINMLKILNLIGFKFNLFKSCFNSSYVLCDSIEFLDFKCPIDVYNFLTPVLERAISIVDRAEKEKRVLRHLLIDQINLVSSRFGKEVYTFSLGEVINNG